MKAKKIISLFLVITTMICSFTVFTHATNDHLALSTEKINVETIFMNNKDYYFKFSEQLPNSMIDKDSVSVIGVTPLYDLASNQTIAYLVDVCDENDVCAYYVINSTTFKVIEFCETASAVSQGFATSARSQNDIFYYSPLKFWKDMPNDKLYDLRENEVVDRCNLSIDTQATNTIKQQSTKSIADDIPVFKYISNVPDYQQANGYVCINTSILNVIAYWDAQGLSNLIPGSIDNARAEIQTCLVAAGGSGANSSIPGAINTYSDNHGYYSDVNNMWYPSFFDLQFEIYYGDPCLVGFPTYYGGGHMTTGVGYNTIDNIDYAIVHDNHSTTPCDVVIAFSEVDFVSGIQIWE